ncbi:MAG: hypothetical protein VB089_13145 [Anaerolineaceae bacterium]|nr:hypothetical protein [Anaerolineaceae bacterium]
MLGKFSIHGWIGLVLIATFWPANWLLPGLRTAWAFFPMWLGYTLLVDALSLMGRGTSLLTRNWKRFAGLFAISVPGWWLFELVNERLQNWHYLGAEHFHPLVFFLLASINFSIVIPAVFGTAEWMAGMPFIRRMGKGPRIVPNRGTTWAFFLAGWVMLGLMLAWPQYFFPFAWLSLYFIIEPLNVWLGNPNLAEYTRSGNWRPVVALFCGVLVTGFFWEMWNYFSYPKWIYTVPWVNFGHVFEMPILGYGGYLPFSLELFALYHLVMGILKIDQAGYLNLEAGPLEKTNRVRKTVLAVQEDRPVEEGDAQAGSTAG